ncbi:MAG: peptidase S10 [Acidobacteria bacterium]|nr:MAG: peptidase S10 [Acidobacteriota bacterium]
MAKDWTKRLFCLLLFVFATAAFGQEKSEKKSDKDKEPPKDQIVTSTGTVRGINYTARAGTIVLKTDDGDPRASFFFVYYSKDGADPAKRPITFTFNGGPGSSSVWLHMGAFGPKRVAYADDEGHAAAPPYKLVDNEATLLDVSDLVFIDPVTTGFSRAIPFNDAKKFHGFEADIESVGSVIRLITTRYARWSSPKFLAGESYGTTRAAGLSGWLHDQGFYLNGIVLISSILNFGTARFDTGNDLPYIVFLPTYSATAWYHKRLSADLQALPVSEVAAQAEQFALGEYTAALMKGDNLTDAEKQSVIAKLARFSGLAPKYLEQTNLRIDIDRFDKELMRDQRRTVGRLDARFIGVNRDAAGEEPDFDPSYAAIFGEYTATFNDYARRVLKFESDLPYEILTDKVRPWSFDRQQNRYLDVAETLRDAMTQNQYLRVFVANGYYDLATPFAATRYTFSRMQLDPSLRGHVTMGFYPAGHMMYIEKSSREKLHDDVSAFIKAAVPD